MTYFHTSPFRILLIKKKNHRKDSLELKGIYKKNR